MTSKVRSTTQGDDQGQRPPRPGTKGESARVEGLLRDTVRVIVYAAVALAVAVFLLLRTPGIPGYDPLYHFRHAQLYAQHGIWTEAFPWLAYSTMNRFSGDIGYGFHLFLIPFTLLRDEMLGLKLAAAFETAIVLVLLYLVLRRHGVRYAFAWPFLLLFMAPPIIFTFVMARPQILTMGFFALLLSFMVKGPARGVFLASFGLAFFHLNAFPVVLVVVLGVAVTKGMVESRWEWWKWGAALAGIAAAWLLRPNPLGVAKLEYHQILVHEMARHARLPLLFGREWMPVSLSALASFVWPLLLWAAGSVAIVVASGSDRFRATRDERTFMWSNLALSVLFFAGMIVSTKRLTPLWATCAVIVPAAAFTLLFGRDRGADQHPVAARLHLPVALVLAALLGALAWNGLRKDAVHARWTAATPHRFKGAAQWLREHAGPGDIVYNVTWDMFPELFFWNPNCYYVSGLDPVFLYAYDPGLYWKYHHLATGTGVAETYDRISPIPAAAVDTYRFIHDDLRASYVVIDGRVHWALDQYLRSDPRFALVFEDQGVAVYSVGRSHMIGSRIPLPGER